jgi:hypothetical protein
MKMKHLYWLLGALGLGGAGWYGYKKLVVDIQKTSAKPR